MFMLKSHAYCVSGLCQVVFLLYNIESCCHCIFETVYHKIRTATFHFTMRSMCMHGIKHNNYYPVQPSYNTGPQFPC